MRTPSPTIRIPEIPKRPVSSARARSAERRRAAKRTTAGSAPIMSAEKTATVRSIPVGQRVRANSTPRRRKTAPVSQKTAPPRTTVRGPAKPRPTPTKSSARSFETARWRNSTPSFRASARTSRGFARRKTRWWRHCWRFPTAFRARTWTKPQKRRRRP